MAQSVEHVIGNDEVISSILITSSRRSTAIAVLFLFLFNKQVEPHRLNLLVVVFGILLTGASLP